MSIETPEHDQIEDSNEEAFSSKKTYVSPTFNHIESISSLVAGFEGIGGDGGAFMGDTADS